MRALTWPGTYPRTRPIASAWVAAAAFALIAVQVVRAYLDPGAPVGPFGTTGAPYSDALGPWIAGGLALLFDLPAPSQLVRPTVGVFWSSLLAATGRVESVPLFFTTTALAALTCALFLLRDRALRNAYAVVAIVVALGFEQTWGPLAFTTANVDFAAFAFTFTGAMLLMADDWKTTPDAPVVLAAALMLGIAGAIRGPMLLAGPVMLAARWWATVGKHRTLTWVLAGGVFALPLVADVLLQHRLGIVSNATGFMFCVYWDPSHSPSAACAQAYLTGSRDAGAITREYVAFLLSRPGVSVVANGFIWRIARDLAVGANGWITSAAVLGVGVLAATSAASSAGWRRRAYAVVGCTVLFALLCRWNSIAGLAWLAVALVIAAWHRLLRAGACLIAYASGTLFLVLLGVHSDRYEATFAFLLYLGLGLLITDFRPGSEVAPSPSRLAPVAWLSLVPILFLYVAHAVLPSTLRATYINTVDGRPAALKLADDPRIDRSLYFTGARELVYTRHDALPVGAVRGFSALAVPGLIENASFRDPNAFVQ